MYSVNKFREYGDGQVYISYGIWEVFRYTPGKNDSLNKGKCGHLDMDFRVGISGKCSLNVQQTHAPTQQSFLVRL